MKRLFPKSDLEAVGDNLDEFVMEKVEDRRLCMRKAQI